MPGPTNEPPVTAPATAIGPLMVVVVLADAIETPPDVAPMLTVPGMDREKQRSQWVPLKDTTMVHHRRGEPHAGHHLRSVTNMKGLQHREQVKGHAHVGQAAPQVVPHHAVECLSDVKSENKQRFVQLSR